MEIIDKKGRLFGRVNVIDLSVILILVAMIAAAHSGYKNMLRIQHEKKERTFRIRMLCTDIPVDVADMIKAGDIEEGLLEIVSVERIDTRPLVDPADITRTYPESRRLSNYKIVSQLIVTFRGVGWTKHGRVYFSDLAKKVGDYLTFTPLGYNLTGRIIEIEEIT